MISYCLSPECVGVPVARGLCRKHYDQSRHKGFDNEGEVGQTKGTCQREGCEREVHCKRICRAHYQADYRKRAWDKKVETLRKELEN